MARLRAYREKRAFDRTPEPVGSSEPGTEAGSSRYVVHKHASRRPHYDLRLEQDGVLRSWALPKGPSLTTGEKRLAVEVEAHPLAYADFEGVIPAGAYGAGTVMLWDRGRWSNTSTSTSTDRLDIELEGVKLRGRWTLARTTGRDATGSDWLLIKRRDRLPEAPRTLDDTSVLTGRTMDEIARGVVAERPHLQGIDRLHGARKARLVEQPGLQLATLVPAAPDGDDWLHEIKLDGYRLAARVEAGRVRLTTRNGIDWTERFGAIASALAALPVDRALLDGEVVALGSDGISSFRSLQEALSAGRTEPLVYHAFDLLHLDDHDLRNVAQIERKATLARLLRAWQRDANHPIRYTDHIVGKGSAFHAKACALGLEGIISKRPDAPYRATRGRHWLKTKCTRHADLVVGGYTAPKGSRSGFGALLLGAYDGESLRYAGRVGSGFGERTLRALHARLETLRRSSSPFSDTVPDARSARWVEPTLVVEVAFTERTREGRLRHPTYRGLREDKEPSEVVVEAAPDDPHAAGTEGGGRDGADGGDRGDRGRRRATRRARGDAEVVGVALSNPDRVLYPDQGITKLALARYYEAVADHLLPGLRRRPLALMRCPQGRDEHCFYQKHPGDAFPASLPRIEIEGKRDQGRYAYVESLADVIGLVQLGVLEFHVWGCRIDDVEHPDQMVLDLDPSDDVPWSETMTIARELRERLTDLGLEGFLRTTGGKGLHVVVPLAPELGWDEVKAFARAVCKQHAADDPRRRTITMSLAKRRGKVFLDYLRNGRGATAIASYSTRARSGAPVAVPIRWEELRPALRSDRYTVDNVRRRLSALRSDPWDAFEAARGSITGAMRAAVGLAAGGGQR